MTYKQYKLLGKLNEKNLLYATITRFSTRLNGFFDKVVSFPHAYFYGYSPYNVTIPGILPCFILLYFFPPSDIFSIIYNLDLNSFLKLISFVMYLEKKN